MPADTAATNNSNLNSILIKRCVVGVILVIIAKYYVEGDQSYELKQVQDWLEADSLQQFSEAFLNNGKSLLLSLL